MASVSSFNEKLWRASISDRPRHSSPKQIYYPKKSHDPKHGYTKKKAKESATVLEYKHKKGELNLWEMEIKVVGNELAIRQLEGKQPMRFLDLFRAYLNDSKAELTDGTIETYTNLTNSLLKIHGDFYVNNFEGLNDYVNEGRLNYRRSKKNHLSVVFKWARENMGIEPPKLDIKASKAEKNELKNMEFKSFLCEAEILEIADRLSGVRSTRYNAKRLAHYFLMLFYIPRRRSDFLFLKGSWISDSEHIIFIGDDEYLPKPQRIELISPTDEGMRLARLVKKKYSGKYIFPFKPNSITTFFKECIDKILPEYTGKVSLHKLRDSGIMHLLHEKDTSIASIKSITGHANHGAFNKYDHPSGKALLQMKKKKYDVKIMLQRKKYFFEEG